jgi:hypothetical protein
VNFRESFVIEFRGNSIRVRHRVPRRDCIKYKKVIRETLCGVRVARIPELSM